MPTIGWPQHGSNGSDGADHNRDARLEPLVVKLSPNDGITVRWEPPLPTEPIGGWRIEADGRQWYLPAPDGAELVTPGPVAIPGLVTIGRFDGNEVLVDLESCGLLAVSGDAALAESLVRSIVLELGAGGVLSNAQVHTIGLDIDGAEQLHRVRSRSEHDAIEHLRTIRVQHDEVLDSADRASMLEVRAASSPIGREVTIVVVRADACARLDELLECAAPQRGVAVVVLGGAVWDLVSRLRAGAPQVLAPHNEGSNTIALADGVRSDVAWMNCLVGRSHHRDDGAAIDDLVSALGLVAGAPFDSPAGCEWAITGGDLAGAMELIERTAFLLTERSIAVGEFDRARVAINKVMGLVGPNEQLTRTLMRLEDAEGNSSGVQDAYGDLSLDLSDLSGPSDVVRPTSATTGLLERREAIPAVVVEPGAAADAVPIRQTVRPRVMLRTFGEVCVEGTATTQALSVAFVVAAAGRAMPDGELAELTGYSPKSLSTVFTTSHEIVDREAGRLRLRSGVWTDHGWMLECARRARSADEAGDVHEVSDWLRSLFAELNRVDAGAYASPPGKKAYWSWVDDFPVDVSARMIAENQLVEASLVGAEVWTTAAVQEQLPADANCTPKCADLQAAVHTP